MLWTAAACVIATAVFLAFYHCNSISVGAIILPGAAFIFFQGRLMLGALIPLPTLYIYGLNRLGRGIPVVVLACISASR